MIRRAAYAAFLVALALPGTALAISQNGSTMMRNWAGSDRCAQAAQRQFPDFTAEANAKRDQALKQCLANSNLPPRSNLDQKP